jgi:Arm DNA-binding domain
MTKSVAAQGLLRTARAVDTAKPRDKLYKLSNQNGLYLEVSTAGGKSFRLKYRFAGKENRLTIGTYPEITLAEAREKALAARKLLTNGVDPSVPRSQRGL